MEETELKNTVLDFNSALSALDRVSESFKVDAWIPSKDSYLQFRGLDAKQQKQLLGAAIDTSIYNTTFIKGFYDILKENILLEDKSVIDTLTLIDKASIALSLKSESSEQITVVFDDQNKVTGKIDIAPILEKFKAFKTPNPIVLNATSDVYVLKVEVVYPTIKVEVDYDNQYKGNKKSEDVKTTEDVQKLITEAFIGETSKFINRVWINDDEVILSDLKFEQRIKLIEKLPSTLIKKILEVVNDWKTNFDEILTVKQDDYTKIVSIDSLLFLN
jgi:hypothetical protein